jgi:hypothetical protein
MVKKRKLNSVTISRPHTVEPTPVHVSTYHRTKGRLVAANTLLTPSEVIDDESPHLNPWEERFCKAFSTAVDDVVSVEGEQMQKVSLSLS